MSVRIEIEPLEINENSYDDVKRGDLPWPDELIFQCNGKHINKINGGILGGTWDVTSVIAQALRELIQSNKEGIIYFHDYPLEIVLEIIDRDVLRVSVKYGLPMGRTRFEPNRFIEKVSYSELMRVAIDAIRDYNDKFERIIGDRGKQLPYSEWIQHRRTSLALLEKQYLENHPSL